MATTSQKQAFDSRLLVIEEFLLQRKHDAALSELNALSADDLGGGNLQLGLYYSLKADLAVIAGDYRQALDLGQKGAKLLADSPFNRRYGRIRHVLSKAYLALGDLKNAEKKAHEALAAYRRATDPLGQVSALNELAHVAFMRSDFGGACHFIEEAIRLAGDNRSKVALLTGNLGRIRTLTGEWEAAENDLKAALAHYESQNQESSIAVNQLSLAYLYLRRREFVFAESTLAKALDIIERLGLKREKVIYLEYYGELALEKGDYYKAKAALLQAYKEGVQLAPESALVSQAGRRLAEVELKLDNVDSAMRYSQKALDLAMTIGEQAEIGAAQRLIAQIFAARSEFAEAVEHGEQAMEVARKAGDPVDLGRTLLSIAELMEQSSSDERSKIEGLYDESIRIFRKLKLDYWLAEAEYRAGVFACTRGRLSRGFRKLSRAEKLFSSLAETAHVRRVNQFLTSLADQAVALSISEDNEFKLFGKLINQSEFRDLKAGQLTEIMSVLMLRTGADRVLIFSPDFGQELTAASFDLPGRQAAKFEECFSRLIGEEIARDKPTLLLDTRRDPYINELFDDIPDVVASVIVVPFSSGGDSTSYVYVDKLSPDGSLNPFSQNALNFAVGFSDLIAFKAAELQRVKLLDDNRRLKAQLREETAFPNIITRNHQMADILTQVRQIVDARISVTIEGATGTGKDLLARAIHYNSVRRDHRFISVNCAALPETLLESELFGYRKGAFTGADRDKPGLFEEADGGTFFLDEIADMPLSVQAKILRVLEEKEIVRLGDSVPRQVDVRIVSATNKDLKEEMATGGFRHDLYYRLAALTFKLPALSERKEDIPLLVEHFLAGSGKRMSPEVLRLLIAYDWPGNVRELDNEVKKLILLSGDQLEISVVNVSDKISSEGKRLRPPIQSAGLPVADVEFDQRYSLYDYLAGHERHFIVKALKERKGVKKHAAALLNIPESTLRLKIKEYNIDMKRLDAVN